MRLDMNKNGTLCTLKTKYNFNVDDSNDITFSTNLYLTFETDYFTVEIFNFSPILDNSQIYKTKINEYAKSNVSIDDYFEYKGGFINEYMKDICNTVNELYKEHYRLVSDYIDLAFDHPAIIHKIKELDTEYSELISDNVTEIIYNA